MPIDLIIKISVGVLFGGFISAAILLLIRDRAIRLTARRIEAAYQQSLEELRANKDLLQILRVIVEQATAQAIQLGKKEDAINQLRIELDALKFEFGSLQTKHQATYSTKMTETRMP